LLKNRFLAEKTLTIQPLPQARENSLEGESHEIRKNQQFRIVPRSGCGYLGLHDDGPETDEPLLAGGGNDHLACRVDYEQYHRHRPRGESRIPWSAS